MHIKCCCDKPWQKDEEVSTTNFVFLRVILLKTQFSLVFVSGYCFWVTASNTVTMYKTCGISVIYLCVGTFTLTRTIHSFPV